MARKAATDKVIEDLKVKPKEEETAVSSSTDAQQRMIELLEAIDWKLWVLYKRFGVEDDE